MLPRVFALIILLLEFCLEIPYKLKKYYIKLEGEKQQVSATFLTHVCKISQEKKNQLRHLGFLVIVTLLSLWSLRNQSELLHGMIKVV